MRRLLTRIALARAAVRAVRVAPEEIKQPDFDPTRRVVPRDPRAELTVAALLIVAALAWVAFVVAFVGHGSTQILGLTLGGGLALLSAALIVGAKRVAVRETIVEERPELVSPEDERAVARQLREGGEPITRRRLIAGAGGIAATGLAAAAVVPLSALGPEADGRLGTSPWRAGTLLVDERGHPVLADDLEIGSFMTAFPSGADPRELGSPLVVVRVAADTLRLPAGRADWAPEGLLAFSKICTHAGCAIALFRYPLYAPTSRPAALVCPCHYSTFDVARGGSVEFGPAARALPQLPLRIAAGRRLVAGGAFSGPIGPSWWGDHRA